MIISNKPTSQRDFVLFLIALPVFVFGLCSYGCTSDKSKATAASKSVQGNIGRDGQKADHEPDALKNPLEARYANDENIASAKKIDRIAKDVNPADAPQYVKKMLDHLKNVTRIFQENADDCDKATAELKKYVKGNKADMQALRKKGDLEQAKMSDEQKSKLSTQTMLLMGPIAKDLAMAQSHFVRNCREQAGEIADVMQAVVGD